MRIIRAIFNPSSLIALGLLAFSLYLLVNF
jgi:hypothetical protein